MTDAYLVEWEQDGAVFRLARPAKLNSITREILHGLAACLDALEARGSRWLVIVGDGERAFCAGTDLAEAAGMTADTVEAKNRFARTLFHRLSTAPVVSIAAINGLAFGGGLELAMACTFRVAAPHALMSLPEIKLGLLPSYGGTQFLPALVGAARALELMLTGRSVSAEAALAMGLITRIATPGSALLDQARALAHEVTQYGQVAIDGVRRCVAASGPMVTERGLAFEAAEVATVMQSEDAAEGIAAFLEKRPPRFRHR